MIYFACMDDMRKILSKRNDLLPSYFDCYNNTKTTAAAISAKASYFIFYLFFDELF
jgi:hypothetical protein